MPLYEYQCEACGQRFEVIQKYSDAAPETCARCGKGPVQRMMSSPAIQFKGSGWYITDYAGGRSSSASSTSSTGDSESKGESKKDGDAKKPAAGESSGTKSDAASTPSSSTPAKDQK